jgi:hypothetical protein
MPCSSSGLSRRVVLRWDTSVSEVLAASIFRVFETLVYYHNTTRRHNIEELDFNHHRREDLKFRMFQYGIPKYTGTRIMVLCSVRSVLLITSLNNRFVFPVTRNQEWCRIQTCKELISKIHLYSCYRETLWVSTRKNNSTHASSG